MRIWIILLLALFCHASHAGLISGYITNEAGEPLPFASVYILGTTIGTASNPEGYFELELPAGEYEL
ncbi:MAG: carboxypeptidase-like regulatory domain-containing protein, partial [Bacteroidales bacterium]|nr:carboxypeptidase-like regulatory domain-containing protein [Bacteroidales bacterium]